MSKKAEDRPAASEKILKALAPSVREELDAMSPAALKEAVLDATRVVIDTTVEMNGDERLSAAKESVKDYSAGYREVFKAQNAKIAYAMLCLEAAGK